MIPSGFDKANVNMSPPPGMSEDDVHTIRAFIGQHEDGSAVCITRWKPTADEITALTEGGSVWLMCFGAGMPPVALTTIDPFEESVGQSTESGVH